MTPGAFGTSMINPIRFTRELEEAFTSPLPAYLYCRFRQAIQPRAGTPSFHFNIVFDPCSMKLSWSYIPEVHQVNDVIEARISFRPLIAFLENSRNKGNSPKAKLFRMVLDEFYKFPELTGTVRVEEIQQYADLLELVYTLLNPLTSDEKK